MKRNYPKNFIKGKEKTKLTNLQYIKPANIGYNDGTNSVKISLQLPLLPDECTNIFINLHFSFVDGTIIIDCFGFG